MRTMIVACVTIMPGLALAQSSDDRERGEVIKILDLLVPKLDVKEGHGLGSDVPCVFSGKWDQSYHRDAEGESTEPFQPRELLSL